MILKQLRKSIGLTQSECAEFLQIPLRIYKRYENNENRADPSERNRMIKKLYEYETNDKEQFMPLSDMFTEAELKAAAENFRIAASEFEFDFIENISLDEGITAFGYIPQYGSKNGAIICLTAPPDFPPDKKVAQWCNDNGYFCSLLNIQFLTGNYDRSYFKEMLNDWGKTNNANKDI